MKVEPFIFVEFHDLHVGEPTILFGVIVVPTFNGSYSVVEIVAGAGRPITGTGFVDAFRYAANTVQRKRNKQVEVVANS